MAGRYGWTEDRSYGAGDYEHERWGREDQGRRAREERAWRPYEPGRDSPDWRDRSGPRWSFDDAPSREEHHRGFWNRAADEVATWWGDRDAEARRDEDGRHRGRGPRGYRRADARISEDLHDQLTEDPWLDASDIEVRVDDGRVEMRGWVRTEDDRRRAAEIADRVPGVVRVDNDLKVHRPNQPGSWTDAGIYPF